MVMRRPQLGDPASSSFGDEAAEMHSEPSSSSQEESVVEEDGVSVHKVHPLQLCCNHTPTPAGIVQEIDTPFEQLEALRQDGRFSGKPLILQHSGPKDRGKAQSFKRDNKNRPMEASSKRPVPRLREVVQVVKRWVSPGKLSIAAPTALH